MKKDVLHIMLIVKDVKDLKRMILIFVEDIKKNKLMVQFMMKKIN